MLVGPVGLVAAWVSGCPKPLFRLAFLSVRFILRVAGVRVIVRGTERIDSGQTYLFMSNHQSNIDPPLVFATIDREIRVLAKAELFRLPVFGSVLRTARFIPVHRGDRARAIAAVDKAAAALGEGNDFLVFPEGTRSPDGRLLPLKKGPFVMAIKAQVPIAPIVLQGTRRMMRKGSLRINPGVATIEFLEPVPTTGLGFEDRGALRDRVHRLMAAGLESSTELR